MEPNLNFANEYELIILSSYRKTVISFFKDLEKNNNLEWSRAEICMKLDGDNIQLFIGNMSAFNPRLKKAILKFLTQFQKYNV